MSARYLIVLTAGGYRLSNNTFAVESAFCEHLRTLKTLLGPRFDDIVVGMGELTEAQYEEHKSALSVIDEQREGIFFEPVFPWRSTKLEFIKQAPRMTAKIAQLVSEADLVHSHLTYDLFRPVELITTTLALAMKKKVIAITDMDNRRDADMNYRLGRWGKRPYLMCKYIYDPIRDLEQRAYVKLCDLVLFKEPQQVEDYGKGLPHVRLFLDPNFAPQHIAGDDVVRRKVRELENPDMPLRVLYFGRLVAYKGVDKMIEAVALARAKGANIKLDIMGSGPDEQTYRSLVQERGLQDVVTWLAPRPYGDAFFEVLRDRHLLLACPLSADTPRSTWDALASGMPILAFDTPFYSGVGKYTGAVDVTPWPEVGPLADRLVELAREKHQLVPMVRKAVAAAHANTGDEWMKRRVEWVDELFVKSPKSANTTTSSPSPDTSRSTSRAA